MALAIAGSMAATAEPAAAEIAAVWAVDDGSKIKADKLDHPLAGGNLTFDPEARRVRLFAARNETVAFQVILAGGDQDTPGVSAVLDAVGPVRNLVLSEDPDRYFVGRRIEIFAQHYVEIRERTHGLGWRPKSRAEPAGLGGTVPDALIPLGPADTVTVPARRNQGLWVDLYIPRDAAPGLHRGELEIRVGGRRCSLPACQLQVELEVLPATLPDQPTARTMVYFSGSDHERDLVAARYFDDPRAAPAAETRALRARHHKLARRHRITLFTGQEDEPDEELAGLLSGEAFTRAAGYEGPGEGLGQDLHVIYAYGWRSLSSDRAARWARWLAEIAPGVERIYYVMDEPRRPQFAELNQRAAAVAGVVPTFTTTQLTDELEVDIHCALPSRYRVADAERARALGRQQWIYNGVRPFSGSFMIDDVAVAPRVNAWIQHAHGIERWFYWEATYYRDAQGGRDQIDVFSTAQNFSNRDGDRANGDGLLIYPGRDRVFPEQDRGIDGPLPSIRLKNWRRGIQDVEYLALARAAGHGAFVDELLAELLPAVLADELSATDAARFRGDGEVWLAARRLLADSLGSDAAPAIPDPLRAPPGRGGLAGAAAASLALAALILGSWLWWRPRRVKT